MGKRKDGKKGRKVKDKDERRRRKVKDKDERRRMNGRRRTDGGDGGS